MIEALFSLIGFLLLLPFLAVWLWFLVRILHKAGYSGWWSLSTLFPPLLIILVWVMAFTEWPNERGRPRAEILPPR